MGRKKIAPSLFSKAVQRALSFVEGLESRTLLAQINVVNFGATPNDGRDDAAAIRSAINASATGDVIFFSAGTYNISDKIMVKGDRTYDGDKAILKGDPSKHIFHVQQHNTRIQDLTFEGKPIKVDHPVGGTKITGLVVNNCILNLGGASGADANGIIFTTGLKDSRITNNTFNIGNHIGLYGYYWDNLTIANNSFLNGTQGIHIDDLNDTSRNLLVEQNIFSGLSRMGIEYQGGGDNSRFFDNWYEKPVMTSNPDDNRETFAFSIVADRSNGTIAKRNVIWAPERPDGKGVRIGFETGGDGTLIEHNYVYGIGQVLANTDRNGTTSCLFQNNYTFQIRTANGGANITSINNGAHVDLDWLIERGKAGPNRRFADPANPNGAIQGSGTSTSTPTPAPTSPAPTTPAPTTPTPVPTPTTGEFLSDLNYTVVSNGFGAVEENRSNGEQGANDGKTITLNGKTYAKGLGVHANSTITYNLAGKYSRFFSDVGLDDEVGNNGSVEFEVWVDNAKVFDSGKMTGGTATQAVDVDVTGKSTLRLVVTNAGDGIAYDHGDWANARLTAASTPTPTPTAQTWLSDLNWTSAVNGWGAVEKNRSNGEQGANDGGTISIRGSTYGKGLGVHANSDIRYNLDGNYEIFSSDIGIDDETDGKGSVIFRVFVDGVQKYDSGTVRGTDAVKRISIDVREASELRLVVVGADGGWDYDHADWAGAKLIP